MLRLSDLSIDADLQNLLPCGSDTERSELAANVIADGRFTDPFIVWLNHGIIVDGQTRYDIWQTELARDDHFPHEIIEKHFDSTDHVKAWMIRHQAGRRNWNTSQRSIMAASLALLPVGGTHQNLNGSIDPFTIEEAAAELNVSPASVKRAKHIIKDGSESLKAAVTNGTVTIADAEKVTKLPKRRQDDAVAKVESGESPTVAKAAGIDPEADRKAAIMGAQKTTERKSQFDPTEFDAAMTEEAEEEKPTHAPKHLKEIADSCKEFAACVSEAGRLKGRIEKLTAGPGGGKLAKWWTDIDRCLSQVQTYLKCYRFWAACPECKITDKHTKAAKDCKLCGGHGWIAESNGLSDIHKDWLRERGVKC